MAIGLQLDCTEFNRSWTKRIEITKDNFGERNINHCPVLVMNVATNITLKVQAYFDHTLVHTRRDSSVYHAHNRYNMHFVESKLITTGLRYCGNCNMFSSFLETGEGR